jgi:hypothetical protein
MLLKLQELQDLEKLFKVQVIPQITQMLLVGLFLQDLGSRVIAQATMEVSND